MRLEKIKLAGFKSFVDPTTVPLPGNLVGIVGPNGCGKSNIIDAVRWVMGESSAKHLRGGTMADVIFNGSSSRKPVGMAHVELIFDNSEGKAPGEFAQYREISIKRQVGRDGQSVYLLNGTRCRRKDITDLFLGTGLGARSYAIIEQGTISRLIEAKPDELRAVIEEAAGISRYKDRRHETELRMEHTRDNLTRLNDVREEVGKQIASLQRQARKAEKYHALKAEEIQYRSQLLAIRWRTFDAQLNKHQIDLSTLETIYREHVSADTELRDKTTVTQNSLEQLRDSLNEIQARYYEAGLSINRLEHIIEQSRKNHEQLHQERIRTEQEQDEAIRYLEQDKTTLQMLQSEQVETQSELDLRLDQEAEILGRRHMARATLDNIRHNQQTLDLSITQVRSEVNLQQTRIQQMEQQQRQLNARRERLQSERDELQSIREDNDLYELETTGRELEAERSANQLAITVINTTLQEERDSLRTLQSELNILRAELHGLKGTVSSLETLQDQAMGRNRDGITEWLSTQGLTQVRRLAEQIEVESGWETAVETVLEQHLEALCVEDAGIYLGDEAYWPSGSINFYEIEAVKTPVTMETDRRFLSTRIHAPWTLNSLISGVYCAEDRTNAMVDRLNLADHESLVTPDGWRMGANWVAAPGREDGKTGLLRRERELRELKTRIQQVETRVSIMESLQDETETRINQTEQDRKHGEAEERRFSNELSHINAQLGAVRVRLEQTQERLDRLTLEWNDLEENRFILAEQTAEAQEKMQDALSALQQMEPQTLEVAKNKQEAEYDTLRLDTELDEIQFEIQELRNRLERQRVTESMTLKNLEKTEQQLTLANERLEAVHARISKTDSPLEDERSELQQLREDRCEIELVLEKNRQKIREIEAELRQLNEQKMGQERALSDIRQQLDQIKTDLQANEIRRQTVQEQFDELNMIPSEIVSQLTEEAEEKKWQERVTQITEELTQLGSVNLSAMEEYQEQSTRMEFLEEQHKDLSDSMETLLHAMEKIDQECRIRFRETFNKVNTGLQRMFPKLFGGGQAYLELTDKDLLDTGVSVIARPPGKRNSTIHLLSGGEKALTAVALVFAIFELNPAPFCLLDEVDAPLDDANVGRFSQLVKEMSEKVQFLFISHNKVTMEIAQHLAGVTMKEPGVSRIVAVDIAEAVELAAA